MLTTTQRILAAAFVAAIVLVGALHAYSSNPHKLREVVTHRICYIDINDNKVCE